MALAKSVAPSDSLQLLLSSLLRSSGLVSVGLLSCEARTGLRRVALLRSKDWSPQGCSPSESLQPSQRPLLVGFASSFGAQQCPLLATFGLPVRRSQTEQGRFASKGPCSVGSLRKAAFGLLASPGTVALRRNPLSCLRKDGYPFGLANRRQPARGPFFAPKGAYTSKGRWEGCSCATLLPSDGRRPARVPSESCSIATDNRAGQQLPQVRLRRQGYLFEYFILFYNI